MVQLASEQARVGLFAEAEQTAHRLGDPWQTAVALAHIGFHEARWNKQTEASKHFQVATRLLYERVRNWEPSSERNRIAVLAESAGLKNRNDITYGDGFQTMRARMVRVFTQGRIADALFIARSTSHESQVALLCHLASLYAGAGLDFMPILEEAREVATKRFGADDLTLVAETYSKLRVDPSQAAEAALERLIDFNPASDDKNLQRVANVYLSLGMFSKALNVLAGIKEESRTPEAISTLVLHRILETFGWSPISREAMEKTLKQAISQWRARSTLYDAIKNPRKADEYFHSLISYQNQGLLKPPQIAQYQTVLALKLAEYGILPTSYESIQIKWLGTLVDGPLRMYGSRVLRIEKENSDAYPGIPGTFKGRLVYAGTGLSLPSQFGSFWFFDESRWQPFTVKGRQFVGIGAEANGNAALYMDVQTGAVFTMCVWADRSDQDYSSYMVESLQSVYQEAGALGVRRTLAALGSQDNATKVLDITRNWLFGLPEHDRRIVSAPVTSDDVSAERDASRLFEFLQERIATMKSEDHALYERYFGQMKHGVPIWIPDIQEHVTIEGRRWLASLLNCSVLGAPQKLREIRLVHQYYKAINPDRVFRILYLFSMGQGLSHEFPKLSHRHALRDRIVPDLQRLGDQSRTDVNAPVLTAQLEHGSDVQTVELSLDNVGEPLEAFLRAYLPDALEHGVFIYDHFVPPNMIPNYSVLPGDRYSAVNARSGTDLGRGATSDGSTSMRMVLLPALLLVFGSFYDNEYLVIIGLLSIALPIAWLLLPRSWRTFVTSHVRSALRSSVALNVYVLFSFDLLTKSLARYWSMVVSGPLHINLPFGFEFTHVENDEPGGLMIKVGFIVWASWLLSWRQWMKFPRILTWGILLGLSGAVGNLFDQIFFGSVADWIGWRGAVSDWLGVGDAVFNLADVYAILARYLMFLGMLQGLYRIIRFFIDNGPSSGARPSRNSPQKPPDGRQSSDRHDRQSLMAA